MTPTGFNQQRTVSPLEQTPCWGYLPALGNFAIPVPLSGFSKGCSSVSTTKFYKSKLIPQEHLIRFIIRALLEWITDLLEKAFQLMTLGFGALNTT